MDRGRLKMLSNLYNNTAACVITHSFITKPYHQQKKDTGGGDNAMVGCHKPMTYGRTRNNTWSLTIYSDSYRAGYIDLAEYFEAYLQFECE